MEIEKFAVTLLMHFFLFIRFPFWPCAIFLCSALNRSFQIFRTFFLCFSLSFFLLSHSFLCISLFLFAFVSAPFSFAIRSFPFLSRSLLFHFPHFLCFRDINFAKHFQKFPLFRHSFLFSLRSLSFYLFFRAFFLWHYGVKKALSLGLLHIHVVIIYLSRKTLLACIS